MSETTASTADAAGPVDYAPPAITQEALSLDDAMSLLGQPPKEKEQEEASSPDKPAEPPQKSADEADAPPEEDQGEQPEEPDEAPPPIEPPRS